MANFLKLCRKCNCHGENVLDTKIVLAVVISTILGATIGFGASYVMFSWPVQSLQDDLSKAKVDISSLNSDVDDVQSSVTNLQNGLSATQSNLVSLNSTVNAMDSREWHEVRSVDGSSDTVTSNFELKGKMLKISWFFNGLSTDAWIEIYVRFSNGTGYWVNGSSGVYGTFDAEGAIPKTGLYYLDISSYNANSWVVSISDYY